VEAKRFFSKFSLKFLVIMIFFLTTMIKGKLWTHEKNSIEKSHHSQSHNGNQCQHLENTFRCVEFIKNYDGDTFVFNIPEIHPIFGKGVTVRLKGIDTPEMKGHKACESVLAKKAQRFVFKMLSEAKKIDLLIEDPRDRKDRYGRLLAHVIVDGQSLGQVLLQSKLAVQYIPPKRRKTLDWCRVIVE
jgi:micrococcal nuclease